MKTNFYWSVRRELWENRSIFYAPLIVGALAIFGFLVSHGPYVEAMRKLPELEAAKQLAIAAMPLSVSASMILIAGWFVGIFYSLDTLYGERRDRSILFWKSMPVSDVTTVLAKAVIPVAVVPVWAMAVALATQLLILALATLILMASGVNPTATVWQAPIFSMAVIMLYGVTVHALWFAPIYGWMILVSAWARQSTWLWAILPFFALYALEMVAFHRSFVADVLQYRVMGGMTEAFTASAVKSGVILHLSQLDPARFFSSPNLWLGLAFAAACLYAAIRLRRYREPI